QGHGERSGPRPRQADRRGAPRADRVPLEPRRREHLHPRIRSTGAEVLSERWPSSVQGRILVVDDQKNMRTTTGLLLRQAGHEVLEAESGEEALRLLEDSAFDLLLTDLRMEPMDGMELLARALQVQPDLQVIVMTAYGSI